MLAFFWYLLKVIICSGILFGYYWVFLRNKIFHQYNRFYLLASMGLSLLLPLLKINFWHGPEQNQAVRVLRAVSVGDEYMNDIVVTSKSHWSFEQIYPMVYWLVCLAFLLVLLRTLFIIRSLLKQYPMQQVEDIHFVNTTDDSTPFSFLKYIFWNNNIDINTTTGRQIFKHEIAHIQQKHTYDKLFMNVTLIFCWCNPFFWLYRKELNMIHEFIADKKAVEDSDTASFAAMILQAAYPKQRFELTNNFFYSPIKRRLRMLTKIDNPSVSYFVRLMVLPLAVLVFAAFTFKAKKDVAHNQAKKEKIALAKNYSQRDTLPQKTSTPISINGKKVKNVSVIKEGVLLVEYEDGTAYKMMEADAVKAGIKVSANGSVVPNRLSPYELNEPLYVVNGKETDKLIALDIKPEDIDTVRIIKIDLAKRVYGDKGKNGVVIINMKPGFGLSKNINIESSSSSVTIYDSTGKNPVGANPLIVIDNIEYIGKTMNDVGTLTDHTKIKDFTLYSAEKAIKIYGETAKEGAIIITTREAQNEIINKNGSDINSVTETPKIYLGINSGGIIYLSYLKSLQELNVSQGYTFVSADIYFSGKGFDKVVKQYTAKTTSLSAIQPSINSCIKGSTITFDNVYVKDKNGDKIKVTNPPGFTIYE